MSFSRIKRTTPQYKYKEQTINKEKTEKGSLL